MKVIPAQAETTDERYRILVRATSQVVITADATGANTDSGTDWWEQLTGQPLSESSNHGWTKCLHPDDYELTVKFWKQSLAAQQPFEMDFRVRKRDEDYCWLQATGVPVRNSDGSFRQWAITMGDITERKRAEQAAREVEERFTKAFQASPHLMTISTLDEGRYLAVNDAVLRATGFTREEMLGRTSSDLNIFDHSEGRNHLVKAFAETGSVRDLEAKLRSKDGSVSTLLISAEIITVEGRKCILTTSVNVTEHRRAEADARFLDELGERIRLSEDAEDLLWETSQITGRYLQVRRCFFAEIDLAADRGFVRRDYCDGVQSVAAEFRVTDYSPETIGDLKAGRTVINHDSQTDPRTAAIYESTYQPFGERAYVGIPLLREEQLTGIFCVTTDQPRKWQPHEISLLETVAERIWLAVEKLRLARAVRESEARYRALVQASTQAVWRISETAANTEALNWWMEFTGRSPSEIANSRWMESIHPDDRSQTRKAWKRALVRKTPYEATYRIRRSDGVYRWFTARGVPIFNDDGTFREWIGTLTDVHQQIMQEKDALFLFDLGEQIRMADNIEELISEAVQTTGEYLQVTRCFFSEVDEAADRWTVLPDYSRSISIAGNYKISNYQPELIMRVRAGLVVKVRDTAKDSRTMNSHRMGFQTIGVRAFVIVPLLREGRWHSNLVIASDVEREWQSREVALLETVAERVWSAIEKLRLDAAMQESEARLRLALESGKIGVWSWDLRSNEVYRSTECNEIMGGGHDFEGTLEDFTRILHPQDAEYVLLSLEEAISSNTTYEAEFRILLPGGHVRWLFNRGNTDYDENGQPLRMLGVVQDITERKLDEVRLRRANERFYMAEEAANGWVYEWDYETGAVERSDNFFTLTGYLPEESDPTVQWLHDLIHPDDRDAVNVPPAGDTYSTEYRLRRRDGRYIYLWDKSRLTRNSEGKVIRLIGRTVDITERKLIEQEREQLLEKERRLRETAESHNRAKDEFLSVISHELRSPLNAVLGYARVARASANEPDTVRKNCEIIERNARTQQKLIEDLLDSARIISGKLRLEIGATDLRLTLEEALEVARPAAEAKGIFLLAQLGSEPCQISGDEARLQQIIWNLLQNAIKFTPAGGRVVLQLANDESHAKIVVSDTGKGIEPDFLPYVFDRFTQQDASRTRRHGGLGLGLSLVKQLTELHGGTIEAESEGIGRGAKFTVTLPLRQSTAARSYQIPAIHSKEQPGQAPVPLNQMPLLQGVNLLIVDDQAEVRDLLTIMLTECGAFPQTAASGEQAMAMLANSSADRYPDVLILDIAMPGEDGYAVLQQIRDKEAERGVPSAEMTPAIALTAFGHTEDRLHALAAGFQMYVSKPIEPAELLVVIASILNRSGKKRHQVP